jgi:hypothetical protein
MLLAPVQVRITELALDSTSRNRGFERKCVVALEELHGGQVAVVEASDQRRAQHLRALDSFVHGGLGEHDVKRELKRPGAFASNQRSQPFEPHAVLATVGTASPLRTVIG